MLSALHLNQLASRQLKSVPWIIVYLASVLPWTGVKPYGLRLPSYLVSSTYRAFAQVIK